MHGICSRRLMKRRSLGLPVVLFTPTRTCHCECIKYVSKQNQSSSHQRLLIFIARKYRDEPRPRQGLLRGREFLMKDLYSFDYSITKALETYEAVKKAYVAFFEELKIPFLVASADSGNMGGNLSHEFHFISSKGEDTVIECSQCHNTYNEELSDGQSLVSGNTGSKDTTVNTSPSVSTDLWVTISHDMTTLVRCWYPRYQVQGDSSEPIEREINSHAIRAITAAAGVEIDASVKNPVSEWLNKLKTTYESHGTDGNCLKILDLYDYRVKTYNHPPLSGLPSDIAAYDNLIQFSLLNRFPGSECGLDLIRVIDGDRCQRCLVGSLHPHTAVELGHTFHLGTRYSKVLRASVAVEPSLLTTPTNTCSSPSKLQPEIVAMQMGCHGIGISRLIAAAADVLSDERGLNWPKAIAPYQVAVLSSGNLEADAEQVYDLLTADCDSPTDVILDDRQKPLGWKLKDADLIGYPVIVVLGKAWRSDRMIEVQCRRLSDVRMQVPTHGLVDYVRNLLDQL